MKKQGTPYTEARAARICAAIVEGETVRQVCAAEGISSATFFRWLREDEAFHIQYAAAKEIQIENLVEEMLAIADDTSHDIKIITSADGSEREAPDHEVINRSRLRVDTRKWLAAKLLPRKYGDRQQMEVTGANGGPVEGRITVEFVRPKSRPEGGDAAA